MSTTETVDADTTIIVLTGPPASGKTTIVSMLNDMGIPCLDTGELVEEEYLFVNETSDATSDAIWEYAEQLREEYGNSVVASQLANGWLHSNIDHSTDVVCISSIRHQASIDWLRETFGNVLSIRIYAPPGEREERYIDRRVTQTTDTVDERDVIDLRTELYDRESREQPYPEYDLTLVNDHNTSVSELWRKLNNIISATS